jgi:hypothetical protein
MAARQESGRENVNARAPSEIDGDMATKGVRARIPKTMILVAR